MKPLLFLSYKSFINGVVRAFSSPRRIIGMLFFFGYYLFWFVRPAMTQPMPTRLMNGGRAPLEFPPLQIIDAVVFAIFALVSMFLMLGSTTQMRGFQPADVDVLFPTPISPKVVLLFRMVRDYLFTLIFPFVIILFGLRPVRIGWEALFRNMPNPEYSGMALRLIFLNWILLSMVWISINYAISLAISRSDSKSDRNKKIFAWTVASLVFGAVTYFAYAVSQSHSVKDVLTLAGSPVLRTVFFTATLATMSTMAAFKADILSGLVGFFGLIGIIGGAFTFAIRNAGWMYDQAAVKGFKSKAMRDLQRKGDTFAMLAEHARSGKVKAGKATWMFKIRWQGAMALVWKEIILQIRGLWGIWAALGVVGLLMSLMPIFIPDKDMAKPIFYFVMQAATVFMATTALSQTGFIEVLRRVDLQKPLPFRPQVVVAYEILSKSLLGTTVCIVSAIVATIADPGFWSYSLGAVFLMPAFSYLLSSTMFLVIVLFPDVDDPSQRQFRGLMMMLGTAIMALPAFIIFAGLWAVHVPVWIAGAAAGGTCIGISLLASTVSGGLYGSFNPSE